MGNSASHRTHSTPQLSISASVSPVSSSVPDSSVSSHAPDSSVSSHSPSSVSSHGPSSDVPEPFSRVFKWESSSATFASLHRDLWLLVARHLTDADLASFLFCHPFFYDLARRNVTIREHLIRDGRFFDPEMTTLDTVSLFDRNTRAQTKKEGSATSCTASNKNVAFVKFSHPATRPGQVREVHFKLLHDFRTKNYVSYFNISLVDPAKDPNQRAMFHYFRDGDVWEQDYDRTLRPAANWEKGDIISMRVWIATVQNAPAKFSVGKRMGEPRVSSDTRNCMAILSLDDHKAGCRMFCQFYRNGKRVHLPMRSTDELSLRLALHFVELNDQIQIVKPIELEDLPAPSPFAGWNVIENL